MAGIDVHIPELPDADSESARSVAERAARVLRPTGALARLDAAASWLAGWQRTTNPVVAKPTVVVFVGDHGVAAEGVSAYPDSITAEMLEALRQGKATASVMAERIGASLTVVDAGVGRPTGNIAVEDAMYADRFEECFALGRKAIERLDTDLLVLGEMGIGNTTAAAAVCAALFGMAAEDWVGRGTGIDDAGVARKVAVVGRVRARINPTASPFEILRRCGGAELVALCGAALEARVRSIPVVLDGFVVTAALAPLELMLPGALDHCIAGHRSSEPGHRMLLEKLGKEPLLDLDLRLGEGSGALAAVPLIALAAACVTEVATFDEWGDR